MNLLMSEKGTVRHEFGMGKSGGGKTQYLIHRMRQQILRGGGGMAIDSKNDYEFLDSMWTLMRRYGREQDFRVINIENASLSHTYNPFLRGDATSVVDRFVNTVETPGKGDGEHFKSMARIALLPIVGAIKYLNLAYNAMDLFILMRSQRAMEWLLNELKRKNPNSEAYSSYNVFLDTNRRYNKNTDSYEINMDYLNSQISGLAARLLPYGSMEMGKVMNSYSPQVDLLDCIASNKFVLVMLPSLEKNENAMEFARMFLSDFRSSIATIYRDPVRWRPLVPFEAYLDEFGSYATLSIAQLFEQARGANIALFPFFQTVANLTRLGDEFAIQIMENTEGKTFLNLGGKDSREEAAAISGEVLRKFWSVSQNRNSGRGYKSSDRDFFDNVNESAGVSIGSTQRYDYRVRPEVFAKLKQGEAIYMCEGNAYKLQLPLVNIGELEKFERLDFETKPVMGMNLIERYPKDFAMIQSGG